MYVFSDFVACSAVTYLLFVDFFYVLSLSLAAIQSQWSRFVAQCSQISQ